MNTADKDVVVITLTPAPGRWPAPPMRRLARLLKAMLRGYGWKCLDIRHQPAPDAGQDGSEASR